MNTIIKICHFLFIFSTMLLFAQDEIIDERTGIKFPAKLHFQEDGKDYDLQATGVATKKVFLIKAYSVAHYLEEGGNENDLLEDGKAKQVTLKYRVSIPAEKMGPGISKGLLKGSSPEEFNAVQNEVNKYIELFNRDVKKGDEQIVRWMPGGNIVVYINGEKKGSITSKPFARVVWNQFLGPHGEVKRDDLVSLMKST